MTLPSVAIHTGDCLDVLRTLDAESVHCCITSPPYFGLRDYGHAGQIGLEPIPEAYVARLVDVFREVRRVLRADGTLWLNLGDSFANDGKWGGHSGGKHDYGNGGLVHQPIGRMKKYTGLKPKDLIGIPWRVAFALQADGWVLRQEIIWQKPNPMPESVQDRCTKAHEQLFMFAKATWSGPDNGRFAHITDEDARWLACCIDTEGCIVVKRVKQLDGGADSFAPQVSFGGTNAALINAFVRIVGHGNIAERTGKNAPMFYWQASNNVARDFLHRIYPYLIVKKRQARIGIYLDSLTYYRGGKMPARKERNGTENAVLVSLWERSKMLNRFGNPDISDVPEPNYGRWSGCARYYYDAEAIAEAAVYGDNGSSFESEYDQETKPGLGKTRRTTVARGGFNGKTNELPGREAFRAIKDWRNKRTVWTVPTSPYAEAHFATFPPNLIRPCIRAGCPLGGTMLDCFAGSGTGGMVALQEGRNAILIELNPAYRPLIESRCAVTPAML